MLTLRIPFLRNNELGPLLSNDGLNLILVLAQNLELDLWKVIKPSLVGNAHSLLEIFQILLSFLTRTGAAIFIVIMIMN